MKNGNLNACVAAASITTPLTVVSGQNADVVVIQYMPPGAQKISPFVDGQPFDMAITVGPEYADIFEAANQALLAQAAAGTGDEPFTDFNHEDSAASSRPQRYYWGGSDPKTGGVLLETKLTASGKAAITRTGNTEPDYTRFSPQWVFDKKTFAPLGLPVNQGAFVNRAAFRTINRLPVVSASQASGEWAAGEPTPADRASMDANGKSYEAYRNSKAAYSRGTPAMHGAVSLELNRAADAHDKAADLYDKEGNVRRAQEERAAAGVRRESAKKHEQLINSSGTDLNAMARARAAQDGITLAEATHRVASENPGIAKAYIKSFREGPAATTGTHPFLTKAQGIAQARGCDLDTAKIIAARQDHGLYVDYMRGLQASAQGARMQVATPEKIVELDEMLNALRADGKSTEEAVSIIGYRRPDLMNAYRESLVR